LGEASATTVFLVRHAVHDRVDRVLCGRMPQVRLGAEGRAQAARLTQRLAGERVAALYSSPLERARETAEPIATALALSVQLAAGLTEIDVGEWTGRNFDELHADDRWHVWNREREAGCPPGGEPMRDVQGRALQQIEDWRAAHPDRTVIAVSHSDVIKTVVCGVLGLSLDRYHAFEIAPASVTRLVVWPGGGKILAMNETVAP
jgi:broad specificity phosphatase PhoE